MEEIKIEGKLYDDAFKQFKKFHEENLSASELVDQLDRINRAAKNQLKGGKDKSIWFRFFKGDTLATDVNNVDHYLNRDSSNNKHFFLECVEIAVKENSLQMYYS